MPGVARRIVLNAPVRFVSITARQCSSVMRATSPSREIPALFTRMVIRAELGLDCLERGIDCAGVAHVGLHRERLDAFMLDRRARLVRAGGV